MGSSTNQPSPNIPTWKIFKKVLGSNDWAVERQSLELWRAAAGDRGGRLSDELSNSSMASAGKIAERKLQPKIALKEFNNILHESFNEGHHFEMAKRALLRASASESGAIGFASELFSETASYYASRDLPSYVAKSGRIPTTSESIELKNRLRGIASTAAKNTELKNLEPDNWNRYIKKVIDSLINGGGG